MAFSKYHKHHRSEYRAFNQISRRLWWVGVLPLLAVILQWNALMDEPKARWFLIIALTIAGFFIVTLVTIHLIQSRALKNYYINNKGAFGEHTVSMGPDGLKMKSDLGDSNTLWTGVVRVEQNEKYIFIYTNSIAAAVIPKMAFALPTLSQEFYAEANKFWKGGGN